MIRNDYYIYVYFDQRIDLEPFYVGKGAGVRSHSHLKKSHNDEVNERIQDIAKCGLLPIIERYEGLTEEAALSLEKEIISAIGRKDLGTGTLLNLTAGGKGFAMTPVIAAKISKSMKGIKRTSEHQANWNASAKGRKRSKETIEKHRKAVTGRKQSDEERKIRSEAMTPEIRESLRSKISQMHKGKPWSEARREAENNRSKNNKNKGANV